jgi:hypothetical protein
MSIDVTQFAFRNKRSLTLDLREVSDDPRLGADSIAAIRKIRGSTHDSYDFLIPKTSITR